jgi:hypothetical protein
MDKATGGRCGDIGSDLSIILVTAAQLIFFTRYHRYIAWPTTGPDGSRTWQSLLTSDYSTWLPFPITASIIVIVASVAMILFKNYYFRQACQILFNILGITVCISLLDIFPFDFSVLPSARAAQLAPTAVRVLFILVIVFYATTALVMLAKLRRRIGEV